MTTNGFPSLRYIRPSGWVTLYLAKMQVSQVTQPACQATGRRSSKRHCGMLVASDAREGAKHIGAERGAPMDLQPTITEAIAEHLTVIQQLTAMSHLIL